MAAPTAPSSSSPRRSRMGDKSIGTFTIGNEIGKGSFATVYSGTHKKTGALVAIKSVNLSKLNKKLKDNLFCEIEILKGLHHPHIVALIDCRESATHIHLVMEYCELGDLSYFIKKRESLGDNDTLKEMIRKYPMPRIGGLNEVISRHFLKQLASAMQFLRERDFIHRDVKPQNLLLLPSPQYLEKHKNLPLVMSASQESVIPRVGLTSLPMLKIADFGFARSLPKTSMAETLCGSPLYMAPEILRYEKYDAKADLWSVGTVLFEMVCGRPPFRASNHVELLRKIEQCEDQIRFPKDVEISRGIKDLIRGLLKKSPVQRMPFEDFFSNSVVIEPIPNLVGDDRPAVAKLQPQPELSSAMSRQRSGSIRDILAERDTRPSPRQTYSSSPRDRQVPPSPKHTPIEPAKTQTSTSPRQDQVREISPRVSQRPTPTQAATAPNSEAITFNRPSSRTNSGLRSADLRPSAPRQTSADEVLKQKRQSMSEAEAEQAVRDAREYVLVEKRAVEVNAFADQMATMGTSPNATKGQPTSRTQIARRATTQGAPTSLTGAVPTSPSRAVKSAQGRSRQDTILQRQNSTGKSYGISPSTTSSIANALHHASMRMFGVGWSPHLIGKGGSPDQLYSAFPAYPTPQGVVGLIANSKPTGPLDEDQKAVNVIEESATRSDVVYGFAEVKYKQLIPLAPSMDHGLGGPAPERSGESIEDEGLTVEAIVSLSEEALVLYVKALTLLAKSMDIAGAWWSRRNRGEVLHSGSSPRIDSPSAVAAGNRINSAVQWVRNRFNEVLEKAEFVRLKLIEAQKQLPEDHPGHPNNHTSASRIAGASSTDGAVLSSGITAEKLMYDRALEMSRSAAINEIANEDLQGCEISYITAIRMLEAVLEGDDEPPSQRSRVSSLSTEMKTDDEEPINGIRVDDRRDVLKVVAMIKTRLSTLRKKMAMIAKHNSMPPSSPRPASIIRSGGVTPTLANTPPH